MPIIPPNKKGNFTPAPEGLHAAVCCDVWEPWTKERSAQYGGGLVDQTRLVWLIEEINPETKYPYEVSQIYTFSLHEKAKLTQHLQSWRGKTFTDAEKDGFDLEKLIGASCQVQIVHRITERGTFANVQAVVPLGKGMAKLRVPDDYVRRKDRKQTPQPEAETEEDESVPF